MEFPSALLGQGDSLIVQNVGRSGYIAVLRDRYGVERFLSQADTPEDAVSLLKAGIDAAFLEMATDAAKEMTVGMKQLATAAQATAAALSELSAARHGGS